MPDNSVDPSGNTEAFRAFTRTTPEAGQSSSKLPLMIGGVIAAVVLIALVSWVALSAG